MSKVKHFFRKLHFGDQHHHGRPPVLDPSLQTTPSQPLTSTSPSADVPQTAMSSDTESSSNSNFNLLEEEFQMQLALAISVSDTGHNCVDPETVQINAAKQISLGCTSSSNLAEFMSYRYWSCDVVNYDEKVTDEFYDVCGIDSTLAIPAKIPSLVELRAISPWDNINCEVVVVNRAVDVELRKLEEIVYYMSMECYALDKTLNKSFLVQKIADLIVDRMGGPVSDIDEMFRRWKARNREIRVYLNTVVLPLGSLDIGHSRHRALLFKVLADRINLPCKLVKGSYYTGTDEGAVNLIKLDDGSEYIIDLMGAPGTLIPAEISGGLGLDAKNNSMSCIKSDQGASIRSFSHCMDEKQKTNSSSSAPSSSSQTNIRGWRKEGKMPTEQLEHDIEDLNHSQDAFSYAISAVKGPKFNRDLPIICLEKKLSIPTEFFPKTDTHDLRENKVLERNGQLRGDCQCHAESYLSENEHSTAPSTENEQLFNMTCNKGLGANMFKLESAGHKSALTITEKQNGPVCNRKDEIISNVGAYVGREVDLSGNSEDMHMLISYDDHFSASKIHNMQIDRVLNGVAEILWEDLQIGERIGIGSYGEVYRAEWNGTEVAVKKFMNQDISGDALRQLKCEIEIMLRLRHPNVVLFMGAVTQPPHMSILTEFLPRGSLYKLLHRPNIHIDEKRRIKMALDVAKGMNYLHSSNPIIVHRDLKTPNLLVDKNWVVKVGDFGMSRLQHHTFLSSKSVAGTAEWMAPEVLRNEPSNEKSDVYSFGVILWELATLRVPWTEMNSMQVVGAVGFQDRNLDIPPTVDALVAEIICDCWKRNPQARPCFAQIISRLKRLHRLSVQRT